MKYNLEKISQQPKQKQRHGKEGVKQHIKSGRTGKRRGQSVGQHNCDSTNIDGKAFKFFMVDLQIAVICIEGEGEGGRECVCEYVCECVSVCVSV